ncbi:MULTISPECIES: hypothetical protein [unclassified Desulfovibrio]|uniref:hypothetical protein n=1 Tax=unclassified Desulfovibrio TaxID=2593640 RepID=UPI000F5DBDBD|nr:MULTISPECIES: hypothetical protein [unclassified Desulfovibrio]RRD70452.1 hypothetical protein EII24_06440 [Desulfovibrio sp. OH1209_COT-279]RRD86916.1 hypothetical protein EII23_06440 [Desulfovibrio sp. OH1186_COT-070]
MSRVLNILWWLAFVACAVVTQALVPGLDALVAGVVLLLQERDYKNALWLLPLFILLQEGMGTRPFSAALLWYASVLLFFRLGRWLLEVRSFAFVLLLSLFLGGGCLAVDWLMAPLQNLAFDLDESVNKSLIQAAFLPCAWFVLTHIRPGSPHVLEN